MLKLNILRLEKYHPKSIKNNVFNLFPWNKMICVREIIKKLYFYDFNRNKNCRGIKNPLIFIVNLVKILKVM